MGSESKFKGSHHVYRGHKVAGSYYILVVSGYPSAFMTDLKGIDPKFMFWCFFICRTYCGRSFFKEIRSVSS